MQVQLASRGKEFRSHGMVLESIPDVRRSRRLKVGETGRVPGGRRLPDSDDDRSGRSRADTLRTDHARQRVPLRAGARRRLEGRCDDGPEGPRPASPRPRAGAGRRGAAGVGHLVDLVSSFGRIPRCHGKLMWLSRIRPLPRRSTHVYGPLLDEALPLTKSGLCQTSQQMICTRLAPVAFMHIAVF